EDALACLHAVADDPASAVRARRREGVDRALEAVENTQAICLGDGEHIVIRVPAHVTRSCGLLEMGCVGHRRSSRLPPVSPHTPRMARGLTALFSAGTLPRFARRVQ